jgi:selT/selW/selH-like putative selenoprotein
LTETLVNTFKPIIGGRHPIQSVLLIPSSNGRFEVTLDDQLVYSKAATGKHTTNDFIVDQVRARLK